MKIEKISENQIRCTLTREDLASRKIKLSEFVYGSEKAKRLFKELMDQAAMQYGFEGEGVPIMVEAIPTNQAALVLIITKVDNPEELDARFSKFTPYEESEEVENEGSSDVEVFSDSELEQLVPDVKDAIKDVLTEITKKLGGAVADVKVGEVKKGQTTKKAAPQAVPYRTFVFSSLEKTAAFAKVVNSRFHGLSNLYKDAKNHKYFLVIFLEGAGAQEYNLVCNIGCEYASVISNDSLAFYEEHFKLIARDDAILRLSIMM